MKVEPYLQFKLYIWSMHLTINIQNNTQRRGRRCDWYQSPRFSVQLCTSVKVKCFKTVLMLHVKVNGNRIALPCFKTVVGSTSFFFLPLAKLLISLIMFDVELLVVQISGQEIAIKHGLLRKAGDSPWRKWRWRRGGDEWSLGCRASTIPPLLGDGS